MTLLLLALACGTAPAPGPADVAGCTMLESRFAAWDPEPWSWIEQRWDDGGRLAYEHRTLNPTSASALHEERTWRWDGPLLTDESSVTWEEPAEPTRLLHQRHAYDAAGRRVTTHESVAGELVGTWSWQVDAAGQPAGGTWDAGDDGEIDGLRVEQWVKQPFGWRVDSRQEIDGYPLSVEARELDEDLRELWRSEDWDSDGVSEVVEQHEYDALGRLVAWDLSGATVIDESCTWAWSGDQRLTGRCADDLRDGAFDWVWLHGAGRPRRAVVTRVGDDGVAEAWENITYDWDCP